MSDTTFDCKFDWEFYGVARLNKSLPKGRWRVYYTDWSVGMWEWPPTTAWYCVGRMAVAPSTIALNLITVLVVAYVAASLFVGLWTMTKLIWGWMT